MSVLKVVSTSLAGVVAAILALLVLQRAREKHMLRLAPKGKLRHLLVGDMLGEFMVSPQRYFAAKRAEALGSKNFTGHIFFSPMILIGDLEDRDHLLNLENKGKAIGQWPAHWRLLMGPGSVATITGPEHTRLRKLFTPHLTPQAVARYVELTDKAVLEWLDTAAQSNKFIPASQLQTLTMEILLQSMFGGNATREEMLSMQQDFILFMAGFLALIPIPLGEFNSLGRAINARKRVVRMMETIVARFKARGEEGRGKGNLLESFLNAEEEGRGFSHDELMSNLITLGFAGFDTSAAAMGSLVALLFSDQHKEYLHKLRDEVKKHIPPGELNTEDLKNLPWMNAVVNEVLRYKNPINGGFRVALEDLPLKDGTIIPQGASFMSYAAASNFNEEYWGANAAEFDPERFLQLKGGGADMKYNFVGFGRGARICPGEQLVRLELRVLAVRIAQKYKFEVTDQREVGWAMNMIQSKFKVVKL